MSSKEGKPTEGGGAAGGGNPKETPQIGRGRLLFRGLPLDSAVGHGLEVVGLLFLFLLFALPVADLLSFKILGRGLAALQAILEHTLLLFAMAAMALASKENRHLGLVGSGEEEAGAASADTASAGLKTASSQKPQTAAAMLRAAASSLGALAESGIAAAFFWASLSLVWNGFDKGARVWIFPTRALALSMPLGFLLMSLYAVARRRSVPRAAALLGLLLGSLMAAQAAANLLSAWGGQPEALLRILEKLGAGSSAFLGRAALPLGVFLLVSAFLGAPLFALLGGLALILMGGSGAWMEIAPSEAYALFRGSALPALPLFALAGFLLAESGAGKRLVSVFRALFGWVPGGEALAAVLVSAFFTTFTGASGVTILALGAILAGILEDTGSYTPSFSRGLVAASGAIGLLLPPSAAMILYGVNAQLIYGESAALDIASLFKGGLVPGLVLILSMGAMGVIAARKKGARPRAFSWPEAKAALKPALLELATPVIILALFLTGSANLTEVAAISIVYLLVVEGLVKKELRLAGALSAFKKAIPVLGGTLAVLAAARGLSFHLIDAGLPEVFASWVAERAASPFVFLLFLNLALLAVGCFMDIYSAILIAAPLVIPLGAAFNLSPIHLGVVFIFNLSIGFLTPPVGMSLFLASYAFKKPLVSIYREVTPFLIVQLIVLLLVTYAPLLIP